MTFETKTADTLPGISRTGNGNTKYAEENAKIRELLGQPGSHAIVGRANDKALSQRVRQQAQKMGVNVSIRNVDGDLWFANKNLLSQETEEQETVAPTKAKSKTSKSSN